MRGVCGTPVYMYVTLRLRQLLTSFDVHVCVCVKNSLEPAWLRRCHLRCRRSSRSVINCFPLQICCHSLLWIVAIRRQPHPFSFSLLCAYHYARWHAFRQSKSITSLNGLPRACLALSMPSQESKIALVFFLFVGILHLFRSAKESRFCFSCSILRHLLAPAYVFPVFFPFF